MVKLRTGMLIASVIEMAPPYFVIVAAHQRYPMGWSQLPIQQSVLGNPPRGLTPGKVSSRVIIAVFTGTSIALNPL